MTASSVSPPPSPCDTVDGFLAGARRTAIGIRVPHGPDISTALQRPRLDDGLNCFFPPRASCFALCAFDERGGRADEAIAMIG